jgi:hypothetical protein
MQQPNLIEAFQMGMNALLRFMGLMGGWIVSYPNRILYILLVLWCFFFPYFGLLMVISLLCWAWSGGYDGQRDY